MRLLHPLLSFVLAAWRVASGRRFRRRRGGVLTEYGWYIGATAAGVATVTGVGIDLYGSARDDRLGAVIPALVRASQDVGLAPLDSTARSEHIAAAATAGGAPIAYVPATGDDPEYLVANGFPGVRFTVHGKSDLASARGLIGLLSRDFATADGFRRIDSPTSAVGYEVFFDTDSQTPESPEARLPFVEVLSFLRYPVVVPDSNVSLSSMGVNIHGDVVQLTDGAYLKGGGPWVTASFPPDAGWPRECRAVLAGLPQGVHRVLLTRHGRMGPIPHGYPARSTVGECAGGDLLVSTSPDGFNRITFLREGHPDCPVGSSIAGLSDLTGCVVGNHGPIDGSYGLYRYFEVDAAGKVSLYREATDVAAISDDDRALWDGAAYCDVSDGAYIFEPTDRDGILARGLQMCRAGGMVIAVSF